VGGRKREERGEERQKKNVKGGEEERGEEKENEKEKEGRRKQWEARIMGKDNVNEGQEGVGRTGLEFYQNHFNFSPGI